MSTTIKTTPKAHEPDLTISTAPPLYCDAPKTDDEGGTKLTHRGFYVAVQVFTYTGGRHGQAFTRLDAYLGGQEYWCKLPRHYSPRWLGRLARRFEHQVWLDAKSRDAL